MCAFQVRLALIVSPSNLAVMIMIMIMIRNLYSTKTTNNIQKRFTKVKVLY